MCDSTETKSGRKPNRAYYKGSLLIVGSMIAFGLGYHVFKARFGFSRINDEVRFEEPIARFRRHPCNRDLEAVFTWRNSAASIYKIIEVKPSCGCILSDNYVGKEIHPGETLRLRFTIARRQVPVEEQVRKNIEIVLVHADQPTRQIFRRLIIEATWVPAMVVEPDEVRFDGKDGEARCIRVKRGYLSAEEFSQIEIAVPPQLTILESIRSSDLVDVWVSLKDPQVEFASELINVGMRSQSVSRKIYVSRKSSRGSCKVVPARMLVFGSPKSVASFERRFVAWSRPSDGGCQLLRVDADSAALSVAIRADRRSFTVQFANRGDQKLKEGYAVAGKLRATCQLRNGNTDEIIVPYEITVNEP